jgi:hypothetical protein
VTSQCQALSIGDRSQFTEEILRYVDFGVVSPWVTDCDEGYSSLMPFAFQFLIEKVIRARIYDSLYWKEHCFALNGTSSHTLNLFPFRLTTDVPFS